MKSRFNSIRRTDRSSTVFVVVCKTFFRNNLYFFFMILIFLIYDAKIKEENLLMEFTFVVLQYFFDSQPTFKK